MYFKLKERRKYHGEYKPHEEEEEHAKNLPYLAPPSVEGLIWSLISDLWSLIFEIPITYRTFTSFQ